MKAQDLKSSVLQLAIQGKLVEQNPNDEPASVLLEKIKAEKEQLIKEKKIRKEKPLTEITEEEKPFEIPDSWEWVRLGEISKQITDGAHKTPTYINAGVPFLSVKNISKGYFDLTDVKYISIEEHNELIKRCKPEINDLLFCRIGTLGKFKIVDIDREFSIFVSLGLVKLSNNINPKYMEYLLNSPLLYKQYNNIKVDGSHTSKLNLRDIPNLIIPLPPLEEQIRIVDKIEEVLEKIQEYDKAEKELTKLEKLFPQDIKKSILQYSIKGKLVEQNPNDEPASVLLEKIKAEKEQLIKEKKIKREKPLPEITEEEKPFEIPDSWEWARLGDIGLWGSGATPSRSNLSYYGGNIPWLKTGELKDGYINSAEEFITEEALNKTSVKLNKIGSVLIAMYGATIGRLGILNIEATTNQACCACNTFYGIYNKYLFYYLLSQREELKSRSEGGAQPNISKEKIVRYLIPVPPLEEQIRIVAKVESIINFIDKLQSTINNQHLLNKLVKAKTIEIEDKKVLISN